MRWFFTSDTHAGHGNIIKWSHRPFLDPVYDARLLEIQPQIQEIEKGGKIFTKGEPRPSVLSEWREIRVSYQAIRNHDQTIIANWNSVVEKTDFTFHQGDLSLHKSLDAAAEFLHSLNGKIFFIRGNHDSVADKLYDKYPEKFVAYKDYHCFSHKDIGVFVMSHYAHFVWDRKHHGSIHTYGHSHGKLLGTEYDRLNKCTDVGVDTHNFTPLTMDDLVGRIKAKGL